MPRVTHSPERILDALLALVSGVNRRMIEERARRSRPPRAAQAAGKDGLPPGGAVPRITGLVLTIPCFARIGPGQRLFRKKTAAAPATVETGEPGFWLRWLGLGRKYLLRLEISVPPEGTATCRAGLFPRGTTGGDE